MKSPMSVIIKYDFLGKAFKFIVDNNKSNTAPYHNLNHLLVYTKAVEDIVEYEYEGEIQIKTRNSMLIAAIFHDFNHSAGRETDDKNIEDAKEGVRKFLEQEKINVDIEFIDSLLDATQYPYVIPEKELSEYQKIMRDADLFQLFQPNWVHQCIFGLSQESSKTIREFVDIQLKFLSSAKFHTLYGKEWQRENWNRLIAETKIIKELLK